MSTRGDGGLAQRLAVAEALATERARMIERLEVEIERLHALLGTALKAVR